MLTTAQKITEDKDLKTFIENYDRARGASTLSLEFLQGCDDVFLFHDQEGTPVAGYSINVEQAYRTLDLVPAELAAHFRKLGSSFKTYELGTIWVDADRRNGREKLELWLHVFGSMIARADTVMVGSTYAEEIYNFYHRYGMKLVYYGPIKSPDGDYEQGWIIYCDNLAESKVPEMYEALKKRLG